MGQVWSPFMEAFYHRKLKLRTVKSWVSEQATSAPSSNPSCGCHANVLLKDTGRMPTSAHLNRVGLVLVIFSVRCQMWPMSVWAVLIWAALTPAQWRLKWRFGMDLWLFPRDMVCFTGGSWERTNKPHVASTDLHSCQRSEIPNPAGSVLFTSSLLLFLEDFLRWAEGECFWSRFLDSFIQVFVALRGKEEETCLCNGG